MASQPPVARTSITLPHRDLSAADRIALALDRSRSWVFAEAIRRWSGAGGGPEQASQAPVAVPPAPAAPTLPPASDPAAMLRLSVTARLQRSQQLTAEFRRAHPRGVRTQIVAFATQGDFEQWKGPA